MRGDGFGREPPQRSPDGALWRRSRMTDVPEDAAERYLDLAGFADGQLDPDDQARVGEWLDRDPIAAGDVAAARTIAGMARQPPTVPEAIIARALSLVGAGTPQVAAVIPFPSRQQRERPRLNRVAGWGSLVAALAVASWLGFSLGVDTSLSFTQSGQAREDGFLHELLDPSTGFLRDLPGGFQT